MSEHDRFEEVRAKLIEGGEITSGTPLSDQDAERINREAAAPTGPDPG